MAIRGMTAVEAEKYLTDRAKGKSGGASRRVAHVTGRMNKTEARYEAEVLRPRQLAGEIAWYRFEGLKLRLADKTFYDTDFAVMLTDGTHEIHEVKGFMRDDAAVKIKVAAEQYPYRFLLVRFVAGKWMIADV